jgi:7-cyano-7-deazaguanine synthase
MSNGLLLSGGIDSIALAYWKRPRFAFTVDYGQVCAAAEIRASRAACKAIGIEHHLVCSNCIALGSGDLASVAPLAVAPMPEWWPFRNQLLATLAGMRALSLGVSHLMMGSVRSDCVHVDGTAEFYLILDRLMSMQEGSLRISAPGIGLTSAELVRESGIPMEILCWAHSCHKAIWSCGKCRGCNKHYSVMEQLGYAPY